MSKRQAHVLRNWLGPLHTIRGVFAIRRCPSTPATWHCLQQEFCCPAVLLCCPVHGSKHPKPMCTYGDHAAQHVTDGGRSRAGLRPYDFLNDFLGAVMSCHVSSLRLAGYREMIFCVASALEFAMVRKELRRH